MNNLVIVVFDSCRYDTFVEADTPNIDRLGPTEYRHSYATWTAPSHYNLLMGLLPHPNPTKVHASEYYRKDLRKFQERLGLDKFEGFKSLAPELWFPTFLKGLGYKTYAMVSLPVLNPNTTINRDWDWFELRKTHNDLRSMVEEMRFGLDPCFYLLNTGETHYPYVTPEHPENDMPRIHGFHGAVKHLGDEGESAEFFASDQLDQMYQMQVDAVAYLDKVIGELYDLVPKNTWIIVTSDHGELFGEEGFFGHGPINHRTVLQVPFVEGMVP